MCPVAFHSITIWTTTTHQSYGTLPSPSSSSSVWTAWEWKLKKGHYPEPHSCQDCYWWMAGGSSKNRLPHSWLLLVVVLGPFINCVDCQAIFLYWSKVSGKGGFKILKKGLRSLWTTHSELVLYPLKTPVCKIVKTLKLESLACVSLPDRGARRKLFLSCAGCFLRPGLTRGKDPIMDSLVDFLQIMAYKRDFFANIKKHIILNYPLLCTKKKTCMNWLMKKCNQKNKLVS